jgi:hypothetical protein
MHKRAHVIFRELMPLFQIQIVIEFGKAEQRNKFRPTKNILPNLDQNLVSSKREGHV